jgi:hypothetical protein
MACMAAKGRTSGFGGRSGKRWEHPESVAPTGVGEGPVSTLSGQSPIRNIRASRPSMKVTASPSVSPKAGKGPEAAWVRLV